jgi:CHAT domain-containing protein
MDLNLRADLVVLSACETARGRIGAGEGVIGMSWAFFVAGCRTTVVSQWQVNSPSTSELMAGFYKHLRPAATKNRKMKSDALRLAALELIKNPRYRHPYYWAGFVMIGSNK